MKGLVNVPVADLRREPSFQSERISQGLFNMAVELGERRDGYLAATLPDGYTGWMYANHLFYPTLKAIFAENVKVKVPFLTVYAADRIRKISVLTFNTAPRVLRQSGEGVCIGSAEGVLGWVKKDGLIASTKIRFSVVDLIKKGIEFSGTPYLWGGISSFGFDCSGFLFTLFDFFGKKIPRDSSQQIKMGEDIPLEKAKAGDLLFFPGHVALCAGRNKILHANLRGGGVTLDSIRPADKDYNPIIEKLSCVRRIV